MDLLVVPTIVQVSIRPLNGLPGRIKITILALMYPSLDGDLLPRTPSRGVNPA